MPPSTFATLLSDIQSKAVADVTVISTGGGTLEEMLGGIMLNRIYQMDCLEGMKLIPDGSIDLTVTSPPYDNLRSYNGYSFDFEGIAQQLYRVTKPGGVVVWVVNDETKDFCESLTSYRQALYFVESCGFNLLDTMIYKKVGGPSPYPSLRRYASVFEFMFIFTKGKPLTFNPIKDRENRSYGKANTGNTARQRDGTTKHVRDYVPQQFGMRYNVWEYHVGKNKDTKDEVAYSHPARFPEALAQDHIASWSNEGDIVLDPFIGSGTTAKMAVLNNRKFIGFEMSSEYIEIANKRLEALV